MGLLVPATGGPAAASAMIVGISRGWGMGWGEWIWEVVGKVGLERLVTSPEHVKRLAIAKHQAEVAGRLLHARADADVEAVRAGTLPITEEGTPRRIEAEFRQHLQQQISSLGPERAASSFAESIKDTARRLDNAEAAVHVAEKILHQQEELKQTIVANVANAQSGNQAGSGSGTPRPRPKPPEEDWLYRWRDVAGEFSESRMRDLLGRVLAGELQAPGKYSLRTLYFLRSLSKREAELIAKLAPFASNPKFIFKAEEALDAAGLNFEKRLELQEIGILDGVDGIGLHYGHTPGKPLENLPLVYSSAFSMIVARAPEKDVKAINLPVYRLTAQGVEILSLYAAKPNEAYVKALVQHAKNQGYVVCSALSIPLPGGLHRLMNIMPLPEDPPAQPAVEPETPT